MTNGDREDLLVSFNSNPPASQSSIARVQAALIFPLPADYIQFLLEADGGEGFIGKSYLDLWPVEQLIEMNAGYHVAEFAPGLFLFGSDGGGEAFGFDIRSTPVRIVIVPFDDMELPASKEIAQDFQTFLFWLFRS